MQTMQTTMTVMAAWRIRTMPMKVGRFLSDGLRWKRWKGMHSRQHQMSGRLE